MKIKIYRRLSETEKLQPTHPLAVLLEERECEKITLSIVASQNLAIPFIDSITIDNDRLVIEKYKEMTFLQVFNGDD